jgi:hypothetical protein
MTKSTQHETRRCELNMPTFVMISRHSPENCPNVNEKVRKVWLEFFNKVDGLMKKHGIKNIGSWTVGNEHLTVMVMDAPSLEVFERCMMEPEVIAFGASETTELKRAWNAEEVMKFLKM